MSTRCQRGNDEGCTLSRAIPFSLLSRFSFRLPEARSCIIYDGMNNLEGV